MGSLSKWLFPILIHAIFTNTLSSYNYHHYYHHFRYYFYTIIRMYTILYNTEQYYACVDGVGTSLKSNPLIRPPTIIIGRLFFFCFQRFILSSFSFTSDNFLFDDAIILIFMSVFFGVLFILTSLHSPNDEFALFLFVPVLLWQLRLRTDMIVGWGADSAELRTA